MTVESGRPDVLIVVMDCVRFSDFAGGTSPVAPLPFSDGLRKECLTFPRAVSVASWTIPAHASLFTGLYPWESGAHAKEDLRLNPAIPRLAERLGSAGYHSLGVSANPVVFPTFGLLNGFQQAYWASWWEPFLRLGRGGPGATWDSAAPPAAVDPDSGRRSSRQFLLRNWTKLLKVPFVIDGASRFLQKVQTPERGRDLSSVPWIEGAIDRWLGRQSSKQNVFVFVNLLEAHEPYLTDSELTPTLKDWLEYSRCRQDFFNCATGRWNPSAEERAMLRKLYRHMIRVLDRRLKAIVEVFQKHSRWDNTLMVLTSDHGQAFAERGILFHTLRIDEGVVRIPLWVRYPDGSLAGKEGVGWASLVDVAPTVLKAAGVGGWNSPSGFDLRDLANQPRPTPALTMSDGLVWPHVGDQLPPERRAWLDRIFVGAYQGDIKVVYEARSGILTAYDVAKDPQENHELSVQKDPELDRLIAAARSAGERMCRVNVGAPSSEVENRLRGWGYV